MIEFKNKEKESFTMKVVDLEEFQTVYLPTFKKTSRILGIDLGKKRIGLALSDPSLTIASPYKVVMRDTFKNVRESLQTIIKEMDIGCVVVGLPVKEDGSAGRAVQGVRHFIYNLSPYIDLPVVYWDERLSTLAVERLLDQTKLAREKKTTVVDKMAASYILQGFLDAVTFTKA